MKPEIETTAADEVWKPVKGFEGSYEVSNLGRVRSLDRIITSKNGQTYLKHGQMLKLSVNRGGYYRISLSDGHRHYTHTEVHRLVARHFVPGYKKGLVVNHIDENKLNNRADNLEWCTYQYNLNYSDVIAWKRRKVYQYDRDGNFIAEHKCCADVERMLGTYQGAMGHVLYESKSGVWKGYRWSFEKRTKAQWEAIYANNKSSRRAVMQYTEDGKDIERFNTMQSAADKLHVSVSAISCCCRGKTKQCAGYKWRYVM